MDQRGAGREGKEEEELWKLVKNTMIQYISRGIKANEREKGERENETVKKEV